MNVCCGGVNWVLIFLNKSGIASCAQLGLPAVYVIVIARGQGFMAVNRPESEGVSDRAITNWFLVSVN